MDPREEPAPAIFLNQFNSFTLDAYPCTHSNCIFRPSSKKLGKTVAILKWEHPSNLQIIPR